MKRFLVCFFIIAIILFNCNLYHVGVNTSNGSGSITMLSIFKILNIGYVNTVTGPDSFKLFDLDDASNIRLVSKLDDIGLFNNFFNDWRD